MSVKLTKDLLLELLENNGKYVANGIANSLNMDVKSEEFAIVLANAYNELAKLSPDETFLSCSYISASDKERCIAMVVCKSNKGADDIEEFSGDVEINLDPENVEIELPIVKSWLGI